MAFADIIATNVDFGADLGRLTDWRDQFEGAPATVPDIFLDAARHELKLDLGRAWGYDLEDAAGLGYLDERADTVAGNIRRALALMQTTLAYESIQGDDDDLSTRLARQTRAKYRDFIRDASTWGVIHTGTRVGSVRQMI